MSTLQVYKVALVNTSSMQVYTAVATTSKTKGRGVTHQLGELFGRVKLA